MRRATDVNRKGIPMKKSLLAGRRRWIVAGTAGALLVGSAALATTAFANDSDDTSNSDKAEAAAHDDDDDTDELGDDGAKVTTPKISAAQAAETAGAEVPDGVVESVELHGPADSPVWKVEIITADDEHEVYVNATDGTITNHDKETDDTDQFMPASAIADAAAISIDDAAAAALAEVGADGTVISVEQEGTAKAPQWDVDVVAADGTDHEVTVNAVDGSISKSEADEADDDSNDDSKEHSDDDSDDHGSDDQSGDDTQDHDED